MSIMVNFNNPSEKYKYVINDNNTIRISIEYILENNIKINSYSSSITSDDEEWIYHEFFDNDLNLYILFENKNGIKEWYKFEDEELLFNIKLDNSFAGNPLKLKEPTAKDIWEKSFKNTTLEDDFFEEFDKLFNESVSSKIFDDLGTYADFSYGDKENFKLDINNIKLKENKDDIFKTKFEDLFNKYKL